MIYLLAIFVTIPIAVHTFAVKVTQVFHYETTETGWQIRWGLANQIANTFILFWLVEGLLIGIYVYADIGVTYKQLVIVAGFVMFILCLVYLRSTAVKSVYVSIDKKTGALIHYDWYVYLHEIDRFDYKCVSDGDGGDQIFFEAVLKTGTRVQFNTFTLTFTRTKDDIYSEVLSKLREHTGILL